MNHLLTPREIFAKKIKVYDSSTKAILEEEEEILAEKTIDKIEAASERLYLAELMLNLTSHYLIVNGISKSILNKKNDNALNEARRSLGKSLKYLEDIVTDYIDAPFSSYEKQLADIEHFNPAARYALVRKIGLTLDLLKNAYGGDAKYKLLLLELEGRHAVIAKNMINLRSFQLDSSWDSPVYEEVRLFMQLVRKMLLQVAERYRDAFMIYSNQIEDLKKGILFLSTLMRLNALTDNRQDDADIRKKYDIWQSKLAVEEQKREQQRKQDAMKNA